MRYLGGGIGHGGNPADIEPPVVPDINDEGSDEVLDIDPNKCHETGGNDGVASGDEDEEFFDIGHVEDGEVYSEDEDNDDEDTTTEL